ncbi:UNVERIFIED_CONTAM: hypothetical protein GTU68_015673 [Idotea baltica]|nr:hypothetical protein [Idotea baltica]
MAKWQLTGQEPESSVNLQYGDFSNLPDYQTAFNAVLDANASFNALPSAVRARFNNDPAQFVEFASDPSNSDVLVDLGLAEKPPKHIQEESEIPTSTGEAGN